MRRQFEDEDEQEEAEDCPKIKKPARVAGFDCQQANSARWQS
jgi:hypothetical protein